MGQKKKILKARQSKAKQNPVTKIYSHMKEIDVGKLKGSQTGESSNNNIMEATLDHNKIENKHP